MRHAKIISVWNVGMRHRFDALLQCLLGIPVPEYDEECEALHVEPHWKFGHHALRLECSCILAIAQSSSD